MRTAGETSIPLGAKVKIVKSYEKDDESIIGLTGIATHPFAFGETSKGWIGIWLDEDSEYGRKINVRETEVVVIS